MNSMDRLLGTFFCRRYDGKMVGIDCQTRRVSNADYLKTAHLNFINVGLALAPRRVGKQESPFAARRERRPYRLWPI